MFTQSHLRLPCDASSRTRRTMSVITTRAWISDMPGIFSGVQSEVFVLPQGFTIFLPTKILGFTWIHGIWWWFIGISPRKNGEPSGNFGGNSEIAKVFHENIQNDQKNEWMPRFIATNEFWLGKRAPNLGRQDWCNLSRAMSPKMGFCAIKSSNNQKRANTSHGFKMFNSETSLLLLGQKENAIAFPRGNPRSFPGSTTKESTSNAGVMTLAGGKWYGTRVKTGSHIWLVVVLTILKNRKVNGKDDIPCMKWKIKNVWTTHQLWSWIVFLKRLMCVMFDDFFRFVPCWLKRFFWKLNWWKHT